MPAQTANLFLLEDLEDVGRTSDLAESDLDTLYAVTDWIKTYVVKPHKDLGRAGPPAVARGARLIRDACHGNTIGEEEIRDVSRWLRQRLLRRWLLPSCPPHRRQRQRSSSAQRTDSSSPATFPA